MAKLILEEISDCPDQHINSFRFFCGFKTAETLVSVNYGDKTANDTEAQCPSELFSKLFEQSSLATFDEESESILEPVREFEKSVQ